VTGIISFLPQKWIILLFETERLWEMLEEVICHGFLCFGSTALYPDYEKKPGQDHKPRED
jgi:hypothetical protein